MLRGSAPPRTHSRTALRARAAQERLGSDFRKRAPLKKFVLPGLSGSDLGSDRSGAPGAIFNAPRLLPGIKNRSGSDSSQAGSGLAEKKIRRTRKNLKIYKMKHE